MKTYGCSVIPKDFANPPIHLEVVFCCVPALSDRQQRLLKLLQNERRTAAVGEEVAELSRTVVRVHSLSGVKQKRRPR